MKYFTTVENEAMIKKKLFYISLLKLILFFMLITCTYLGRLLHYSFNDCIK